MRLRIDLAASVPKDSERPELNEDAWVGDETISCFGMSDGASESYDSRSWAQLLVDRYVKDPHFLPSWVETAVALYADRIKFDDLSWSQQAAFERGSFCTLLGVHLAENGRELEVFAVGDSLACHLRQGALLSTFPYVGAEEFEARPTLLSTIQSKNRFLSDPEFLAHNSSRTWTVEPGDIVLLLTDAVGQWLLRELVGQPSSLDVIAGVTSDTQLANLVLRMRAEHRMRHDDTTVLRLVVECD